MKQKSDMPIFIWTAYC